MTMFLKENADKGAEPVALNETEERVLTAVARELGLLVTTEEAAALDTYLAMAEKQGQQALKEAANTVRMGRVGKLDNLIARSALVIARQVKDPLFTKFIKASALKRKLRAMIYKKYSSKAQSTARKILAGAGKRNMVDVSSNKAFSGNDRK